MKDIRHFVPTVLLSVLCSASLLEAGSMGRVYVDAEQGDDANSGASSEQAFKTLKRATGALAPSGTLHLIARATPFREQLHLDFGGTGDAPLVVEGNGATIDLGTDITKGPWVRAGEEWIFMGQGRPHTRPIQASPIFVDNDPVWVHHESEPKNPADGGVRMTEDGKFAVTFPPGKSPENCRVTLTSADGESAVFLNKGDFIIVRNLTARFPDNDGFNVHGSGKGIVFENVRALNCGDQGISSHSTTEVSIRGAEVAFSGSRAGGIADVNESITSYENVLLHHNRVGGLHLKGGHHTVDRLIVFANKTDALPLAGSIIEVKNSAALDRSFAIIKTSGETVESTLADLISQAKNASALTDEVPYPGVGAPPNPQRTPKDP